MMKDYEPELGQAIFGQPTQRYELSSDVQIALETIQHAMLLRCEYGSTPFSNCGMRYKNDTFEANAYSWDEDEEQPYNFKWKDFEVSWYKHFRRGASMNREMSNEEAIHMLSECLDSIKDLKYGFDK